MDLTDLGNARRFITSHGAYLRYCHQWKAWLWWNGRQWLHDDNGQVERWAKATVLGLLDDSTELLAQAALATAAGDQIRSNQLVKDAARARSHALQSQNLNKFTAMITTAKSELVISVSPDNLDANPWQLNCLNGTVDLRTGILHPHQRENLITKMAPVNCLPNTKLPLWDRFLSQAIPNKETKKYVQKCVGATIVGKANDDLLLLCFGVGGSGKSTFLNSIRNTLGDYAAAADLDTFTRSGQGPRPDLTRLQGRRMVVISEIDPDNTLSLLKRATGNDPIITRSHHQESFEFIPQFTLWIGTDKRLPIPDDDSGAWRRIRELPFLVKFTHPEPRIREQLTNPNIAGSAILAWAIEGCLRWQEEGIGTPPWQVIHGTAAHRREMDVLAEWREDCTRTTSSGWTLFKDLLTSYLKWAEDNGISQPLGRKSFSQHLSVHFEPKQKSGQGGRGFAGIELITEEEKETNE